jgi:hypothetical protein
VANEQSSGEGAAEDDWATKLVKRVGQAVKAARGGDSAAWLSDRTYDLGYRISPSVIAKLDSGHRGDVLSVAELFILSAALGVPPIALLFPSLPDGQVNVLPKWKTSSWDAVVWATGRKVSRHGKPPDIWPETKGAVLIRTVWELRDAEARLLVYRGQLAESNAHDTKWRDALQDKIDEWTDVVRERKAEIIASGGVLDDDAPAADETAARGTGGVEK